MTRPSLHHPRGQNYALLSGDVSLPSDENGIAVFTDVTLVASSSKYLYLMFYCDGAVASWNSPLLRSLATLFSYQECVYIFSVVYVFL